MLVGKVELAEHQAGRSAVEEEVIPFDGGADGRGDHRLAQLCGMLGVAQRAGCACCGHARRPPIVTATLAKAPDIGKVSQGRRLPGFATVSDPAWEAFDANGIWLKRDSSHQTPPPSSRGRAGMGIRS